MGQNQPTILQIIPQLDAGGAELSAVEIADAVVRAGGRAIVLAEPGRLAADIAEVGGEVMPFPAATKNPIRMLANAGAIARIVGREHVDLVHARSRAPAWSALRAARRTGVPFVTTYHGAYGEKNAAQAALQQRDGAGRRGDRQFPLHGAPDRRPLRDARRAHRGDPARRRRTQIRSRCDCAGARGCPARELGRRGRPAGHSAGGAPDGLEGPAGAHRGGSQAAGRRAARAGGGRAGRRRAGPHCLRAHSAGAGRPAWPQGPRPAGRTRRGRCRRVLGLRT